MMRDQEIWLSFQCPLVIPGRAPARTMRTMMRNCASENPSNGKGTRRNGFRARDFVAPRNDKGRLCRPHPIAVKTVGHAVAELHQRDGAGLDIGGVEHGEVAAV